MTIMWLYRANTMRPFKLSSVRCVKIGIPKTVIDFFIDVWFIISCYLKNQVTSFVYFDPQKILSFRYFFLLKHINHLTYWLQFKAKKNNCKKNTFRWVLNVTQSCHLSSNHATSIRTAKSSLIVHVRTTTNMRTSIFFAFHTQSYPISSYPFNKSLKFIFINIWCNMSTMSCSWDINCIEKKAVHKNGYVITAIPTYDDSLVEKTWSTEEVHFYVLISKILHPNCC